MKQRLAAAAAWLPSCLLPTLWLALIAAWGLLLSLRALEHVAPEDSLAASAPLKDLDWLQALRPYYAIVFWTAAGVAVAVLALLITCWTRDFAGRHAVAAESAHHARRQAARAAWMTWVVCLALSGVLVGTSRYFESAAGGATKTLPPGLFDAATVALLLVVGWLLGRLLALRLGDLPLAPAGSAADGSAKFLTLGPSSAKRSKLLRRRDLRASFGIALGSWLRKYGARLGAIFLLAFVAAFAIPDGRPDWTDVFLGSRALTDWLRDTRTAPRPELLALTAVCLKSALAAVAACGAAVLLRIASGRQPMVDVSGFRRQALLIAAGLACVIVSAGIGRQPLVNPFDSPREGLLFAGALVVTMAALFPAILLTGLLLRRDFRAACTSVRYVGYARYREFDVRRYPSRGELALWTLLLFPIYPLLRGLRGGSAAVQRLAIMTASATVLAGAAWAIHDLQPWGQTWAQLGLALLAAAWVYVGGRRAGLRLSEALGFIVRILRWPRRVVTALAVAACLVAAAWPLALDAEGRAAAIEACRRDADQPAELRLLNWALESRRDAH
jgi:hypothetical protein